VIDERLEADHHHAELLAGIIASTVANFGMRELKKSLAPADFMPSRTAEQKPAHQPQTDCAVHWFFPPPYGDAPGAAARETECLTKRRRFKVYASCRQSCAHLAPQLAQRLMTAGLTAAAQVIEEELAARTPVETGELKGAIVSTVEVAPSGTSGIAKVGFGKETYKARWVEFGHRQVGPGSKKSERKELGFTPAHPFLRPAAEASREAARDAFLAAVQKELK
jgi:HK97 gp10 family phage protein